MTTPGNRRRPSRGRPAFLAVGVLVVDQATKMAAPLLSGRAPGLIYPLRNPQLSLGTIAAARWLEVAAMAAVLVALVALGPTLRRRAAAPAWAVAVTVAGAASNVVDRAALGSVRDWLIMGPIVANVADVAVLAGLVALLVAGLRNSRAGRTRARDPVA